jgi:CheY-like chemotaxis protein
MQSLRLETYRTEVMMSGFNGKTILVAEDNEDSRVMLCLFLETLNYKVVEAGNGIEAVELASRKHPDLILMDLNMPDMDGLTAAQRIRQNVELQDIPIIANSGNGRCGIDLFTNINSMGNGFISYLTKPLNLGELKDQIELALTGSTKVT